MPKKDSGYILLHRCIMEKPEYLEEKFTRTQAWIDLILLANWKKTSFHIRSVRVDVPRGALAWSRLELATRWAWSRNRVNRFINELETDHQVKQQKSFIITLISIVNYDKYQGNGAADGAANDTADGAADDTHQKELNTLKKGRSPNFYKNGFQNTISDAPPLATKLPDGTFKIIKP